MERSEEPILKPFTMLARAMWLRRALKDVNLLSDIDLAQSALVHASTSRSPVAIQVTFARVL